MQQTYNDTMIKEALWEEKKKGISTVWIVPLVALLIGGWLFFQSWSQKGPEIEINFKSAAGIEAGKTVIKYKDVVVGQVKKVTFSKDLKSVAVVAEVQKNMKPFLSENTRFWVVQAKLGLDKVQGLDTLLSGVYIVMDPHKGKKSVDIFQGLDQIPVVDSGEKGRTFILKAKTIGSLSIGSPIYYRKLKAGSIASYKLDHDGKYITIEAFIKSPYDQLINDKTRFFNVSGISFAMSANGIDLEAESLVSVLMGGLAFENFVVHGIGKPVEQNHVYTLYKNRKMAKEEQYDREIFFWVYTDDSVRGLSEGAPVEFKGVKIGEVVHYSLVGDANTAEFRIPILIKIEPERFDVIGMKHTTDSGHIPIFEKLVQKGLRAQLQTGNLLTGEQFIDLNIYPDAPPVQIRHKYNIYVIPSVPTTMASLKTDFKAVMKRISEIPFEEISKHLNSAMKKIDAKTLPKVNHSFDELSKLINDTNRLMNSARKNYLDSNAEINRKILKLLDEMTHTTKSIKHLTDYLERHPESLIKGK